MCCKELDKIIQRDELSTSTLNQATMIVDIIKDVRTLDAMEEGSEYSSYDGGSYANRGRHYVRGHYSRDGGSYDRGGSYARDSRGRYSRDGEKDEMINRLERMMEQSSDQA